MMILTFMPPRGENRSGEDRSAQLHHRDQRLDEGIEALANPLIWESTQGVNPKQKGEMKAFLSSTRMQLVVKTGPTAAFSSAWQEEGALLYLEERMENHLERGCREAASRLLEMGLSLTHSSCGAAAPHSSWALEVSLAGKKPNLLSSG